MRKDLDTTQQQNTSELHCTAASESSRSEDTQMLRRRWRVPFPGEGVAVEALLGCFEMGVGGGESGIED
ncbi:unnamed protein product [Boreogadus saida]